MATRLIGDLAAVDGALLDRVCEGKGSIQEGKRLRDQITKALASRTRAMLAAIACIRARAELPEGGNERDWLRSRGLSL